MARGRVALADATAASDDGLVISTDKDDYQPGDTVFLSGSGWPAGDTLDILLEDEPRTEEPRGWWVPVGEEGTFLDSTYVVDSGDIDVTFTLTATSRGSGQNLAVQFTDANIGNDLAISPSSAAVPRGGFADYTVTVSFGGNTTPCTSPLTATGFSTGTSGVFNPTSVTGHSNDTPKTATLRVTTTSGTPLGPDGFTVTAGLGSGCTGSARAATGTINVFGPATRLAFGQQPTNENAATPLSPAVTVRVLDASNNLVANSSAPVTLAIGNNPGAGTLGGTLTQNAVNGIATFPDLTIDKIGAGYTLVASSAGLTGVTSSAFSITLGPAASLAFFTQPSGGVSAAPFATQPRVEVLDAGGNRRTTGGGSGASIALAIVPGSGTAGAVLTCVPNPLTAVAGLATFVGCRIDLAGTDYRLRATAPGLTGADSDPFDITPANRQPTVNAGGPYTVAEGTAQLLSPSVIDPDGDPLAYQWSVDPSGIDAGGVCTFDDPALKNATVTCTDDSQGAPAGRFTLSLRADDGIAPPVSDAAELVVANADPVAIAGGPYAGAEGAEIPLSGSADDPGDNDDAQLGYQWTAVPAGIDAGGACTFDNPASRNARVTCTDDGTFKVRLVVGDGEGGTSVASEADLTVANAGPVAEAGGPYAGDEGSPVQLNGTVTDAGSNDTHQWLWAYVSGAGIDGGTCRFDDETAPDPMVTCTDDGTVELTLKVTDDDGANSEDAATLTLANVNPVATVSAPSSGNEGAAIPLTGTATDAGANDVLTTAWTFAPLSGVDPGATCSFSPDPSALVPEVRCTDDGMFRVTLTVRDDDGGSDVATATISLANVDPAATAGGPYIGAEGAGIPLTGLVSDAGSNDVLTQQWTYAPVADVDAGAACSFDPGASALSPTVTCTDDGVYQLTLTVGDDDGATGTSTASLTVTNVAPVMAALTAPGGSALPATILVGGRLDLETSFIDRGANDRHSAELDCGTGYGPLGAVSAGAVLDAACTFTTIGSKTIRIKVTDDDEGSDMESHTILVKYDFDGFYAPVDRPNTMNVSKAGQAIPLKWTLKNADGTPVTDLVSVTIKTVAISCDQTVALDPVEEYAGSTSGLLNLGGGRYQYNWKTVSGYAGTCKSIALVFGSGGLVYTEGPHAFFSFKK
jgi:hypothetical protein